MSARTMQDKQGLGRSLREAREYLGLSQDDVADAIGLSRSAISLIESGQRKVDAHELARLARIYQRPVAHFVGEGVGAAPELPRQIQSLARQTAKLSARDQQEVLRFVEYLQSRAASKARE